MNKNTVIGTVLLILLMFGWMWWNQPTPEQIEAQRRMRDSIANAQMDAANAELEAMRRAQEGDLPLRTDSLGLAQADSIRAVRLGQKYGNLAAAASGEEQTVVLENDLLRVGISTRGGMLAEATLKQYDSYDGVPLTLFDRENNESYLTFYSVYGKYVTTKDLYFQPVAQTDSSVTMRLRSDDGAILDLVYTLPAGSYVLGFDIHTLDLDNIVAPTQPSLALTWNQRLRRTELGRSFEDRYSDLCYKEYREGVDELSSTSHDSKTIDGKTAWIGFRNQFFSSAIIGDNRFRAGQLESTPIKEEQDARHIKTFAAELEFDVPLEGNQLTKLAYYLGPNDYWLLGGVEEEVAARLAMDEDDLQLRQLIYLGWGIFGWVNRFLTIPLFHLFSSFISNYGIIILLLTLVVKLLIFPFTFKSMKAAAKMRIFQQLPEAKAINEKYPNQEDAMQKQQELMALMNKAGVSQLGGCLPMLIQMPVILALFYFFPKAIELRGQSFLWADDLSTYDAILSWEGNIPIVNWIFHNHISLFCLLMTATNLIYTYINMRQNPTQNAMPGMKWMMYLMPLVFFGVLNDYSSGLTYYYFISTLITIAQTYIIRATMDEPKILAQMKENLRKPGKASKASGWLAKMQEIQRQQQAELKRQREEQLRRQRR